MAGNHTFNGKQSEYDQFYNAAQPKDYYPSYLEGGQWQAQRNGEVVTNAKYVSSPAGSVPESETVASERALTDVTGGRPAAHGAVKTPSLECLTTLSSIADVARSACCGRW